MNNPSKLALVDGVFTVALLLAVAALFSSQHVQAIPRFLPFAVAAGLVVSWRSWVIAKRAPSFPLLHAVADGGLVGATLAVVATLVSWLSAAWAAGSGFDGFNPSSLGDWGLLFVSVLWSAGAGAALGCGLGLAVWAFNRVWLRYAPRL